MLRRSFLKILGALGAAVMLPLTAVSAKGPEPKVFPFDPNKTYGDWFMSSEKMFSTVYSKMQRIYRPMVEGEPLRWGALEQIHALEDIAIEQLEKMASRVVDPEFMYLVKYSVVPNIDGEPGWLYCWKYTPKQVRYAERIQNIGKYRTVRYSRWQTE